MCIKGRRRTLLLLVFTFLLLASYTTPATAVPNGIVAYPRPHSVVDSSAPMIGADFADFSQGAQPEIILDNTNITDSCDVSDGYIFCAPAGLEPGNHNVTLVLNGKKITEWPFSMGWTPGFRYVYPQPGAAVDRPRPVVGLDFKELPFKIDTTTVRLYLDGNDISSGCSVTDEAVFCMPWEDLAGGEHTVNFIAETTGGRKLDPVSWKFSSAAGAADQPVADSVRSKPVSAAVIAATGRRGHSIAQATKRVENVYFEPTSMEPIDVEQPAAVPGEGGEEYAEYPEGDESAMAGEYAMSAEEIAAEMGIELGTQFAIDTMGGWEYMSIGGNAELSSQFEHNALIHSLGLRTQTYMMTRTNRPTNFNVTLRMTGTSDGDVSESLWDLKRLNGMYDGGRFTLGMYDIRPKYTTYTLSGKPLLGFEYNVDFKEYSHVNFFLGKFKKNIAGKRIKLAGFRYTTERPDKDLTYGVQMVYNSVTQLQGYTRSNNFLFGLDAEKKHGSGTSKMEWLRSNYPGVGSDTAYYIENKTRRGNAYIVTRYEDVGELFRTESGFASKALTEFSSTMQYRFNDRMTMVLGFKNRRFKNGGSRTKTIPLIFKLQPLKNRETLAFEFNMKRSDYEKADSTKDTDTDTYTLRDEIGNNRVALTYKKQKKERRGREDEYERVLDLNWRRPLSKKTSFTYKFMRLQNYPYGPETKAGYTVSYELSDWSDINLQLQTVDKDNPALDRETHKLRFGKVIPEANTELSFEFMKNRYLEYNETLSVFKYSKFY